MDAVQVAELKGFINECKSNPAILHDPSFLFFKSYLQRQVEKLRTFSLPETREAEMSGSGERTDSSRPNEEEEDDEIVESDIELDNADVVEADNDPPQKMGNFTSHVPEESREAAQVEKAKAMDELSEGRLSEAVDHLTEAVLLNPVSAILYAARGSVYVKMKKPNAAIRDANAALEMNPDSAKAYKVRGMAKALLGQWEEAANDLHVASKLDYDEEIGLYLKKVEPNVNKIKEHQKKYELLRKERNPQKAEREKQRQAEALEREALSALKEGQVMGIHSTTELETKLNAATRVSRLAILYFTATWCGPCRLISPHFTSLAEKYPKVVFLKADIDEARDVARKWKVSSVPAFFFVKKGNEVDKVVGADKNGLEKKLKKHAT
ncbi:TPR repeat-containing thioredoxin TDX [Linum perenne]